MGVEDCSTPTSDASPSSSSLSAVDQTLILLQSEDPNLKVNAAKDIRLLTKTSQRYRRHFSGAIGPLVDMLSCPSADANEAALAALLNLAVKDEINKINIIQAGALKPIVGFLQSDNVTLQEHSAAALITLSASSLNKPIIGSSGAIPLLVNIMTFGSSQAKVDATMALYNLSTHSDNVIPILQAGPIPPLISLLKTLEEGGILAVVQVVEGGSLRSRECAVGALLKMCESDRSKYREAILREGVIPGLLELTIQGTAKCRVKAQMLLRLLRETKCEVQPDTLENIVCNIISQIDGEEDQRGKAKQMLSEMVQVSMEQSLRDLQQRALVCAPPHLPMNTCSSEFSSK